MPNSSVTAFFAHKDGNHPVDYEDAFAVSLTSRSDEPVRYAIADGATESSFAGQWAEALVRAFAQNRLNLTPAFQPELQSLKVAFNQNVNRQAAGLPWHSLEKIHHGAHATFLGVELQGTTMRMVAVGDSCLFLIRRNQFSFAFPLVHSRSFGNSPELVNSQESAPARLGQGKYKQADLSIEPGDQVFLLTDALAHWFLHSSEKGETPWTTLTAVAGSGTKGFERWIAEQRNTGKMKNDDVTFISFQV